MGFHSPLWRNSSEFDAILGGGKQGFQQAPKPDSFIIDGIGAMGTVQNERKLGYYEVVLSGHMIPQFVPQVKIPSSALKEADRTPFCPGCVSEHGVVVRNQGESLSCNS